MSVKSFEEKLRERREPPADEKVIPLFDALHGDAALPGPDADYRAAGRPTNAPLTRLACCMGRTNFRAGGYAYHFFQYVHLDSGAAFGFDQDGQVLTFRFAGTRPMLLTVRGRNLLQVMDHIQMHRCPWIRVADRDFAPRDATDEDGQPRPIITHLLIAEAGTGELLGGA